MIKNDMCLEDKGYNPLAVQNASDGGVLPEIFRIHKENLRMSRFSKVLPKGGLQTQFKDH